MIRRFAAFLLVVALAAAAHAQVPTPDEFLGYKLGDRFTSYARILDYFNELAKRSNLITVQQFGETYEHRPLVLAVLTSARNRAAFDAIRQKLVALADPNATTPARAAPWSSRSTTTLRIRVMPFCVIGPVFGMNPSRVCSRRANSDQIRSSGHCSMSSSGGTCR